VKTLCNVRGITLHHKASQLVNFDTIKHLALNGISNSSVRVHTEKIKRLRGGGARVSIVTEHEDKINNIHFLSGVMRR
jgi:hypothetical protein